jgi:isopropylmalate/homocitrate/citramalate synthase
MIDLNEPLDQLAVPPTAHTKHLRLDPTRIHIYDDTLRDGEQMPGVAFSPEQKLEMAVLLSETGVAVMDVAYPAVAESDRKAIQLIVMAQKQGRIREGVEILAMCRAVASDIDQAATAMTEIGASPDDVSVLILSTLSDLHLKYKLGKTLLRREGRPADQWITTPVEFYREANIRMITEAIRYAHSRGIHRVEFAAEDASRGHLDYAGRWASACIAAGGTRMCFSDTCGVFTPEAVDYYIPRIVKLLGETPLHAHFHNDFGLAPINTVRALAHGARYAGVTANGIGERAGNCPLHEVVLILRNLYGVELPGFQYERLTELRRLVERYSGIPLQPHEPIIGEGVFSHESGIHAAGIATHPAIYQFIREDTVGGRQRFVFGKHSGAAAVESVLARHPGFVKEHKIEVTPELIREVIERVKDLREQAIPEKGYPEVIESYYQHYHHLGISESRLLELVLEAHERKGR